MEVIAAATIVPDEAVISLYWSQGPESTPGCNAAGKLILTFAAPLYSQPSAPCSNDLYLRSHHNPK